MKAALPNLITSVRFLLALVFFVLMENYHYHGSDRVFGEGVLLLDLAFIIFVVTALTDILDGYLARKWKQESTFGRILDPLVDKVLVIGAFLYLASDHFAVIKTIWDVVEPISVGGHLDWPSLTLPASVVNASGVAVWMVVLILIRELLVTGLRGFSEAQGLSFSATIPGKIKMFVQCVAAGTVMVVTGHAQQWYPGQQWPYHLRDATLWLMVVVTALSMLIYIERARSLLTLGLKGREKKDR